MGDFSELVVDCRGAIEIVGRFLALLELYPAAGGSIRPVRTAWCAPGFVDRRPADKLKTWVKVDSRRREQQTLE